MDKDFPGIQIHLKDTLLNRRQKHLFPVFHGHLVHIIGPGLKDVRQASQPFPWSVKTSSPMRSAMKFSSGPSFTA